MNRFFAAMFLSALALVAQPVDRTKAPPTPPIPEYKLPPVYETKLPNGLSVVVVEDARFPLVSARLAFQAGSKFDPQDRPGLAEAVASVLTEGTKSRTSRQISEETDSMGGSLSAGAGADGLTLSGSALSDNLPRLLTLMADVAMNANFPQDEVALYQQNRIQSLRAERSQPAYLAQEKIAAVVYGSSPYAHIGPTEAAVKSLDPKTLAAFKDARLVPNNATLLLIGKLPARAALLKNIEQQYGAWQQKALPAAPKYDFPAPKRQIVLVDRPGSVQADIHVGRLAPTRASADFFPLMVGINVLGGGANSRMFKDIREKQGFAYDAHSEYDTHRESGDLQAITQVRNEVFEPALKAVLAEMDQMAADPVPADELSGVKNFMAGMYLLRLETQEGVVSQLSNMKILGLPNSFLETYTARVRAVEPAQMLGVAKKYVASGDAAIVVVGDASKIGETLKKFGEVTIAKAE
ncbi:MAG: insulinase family protein [Acidobacteriia bacterium]|nr:insulinase family protein [Terriglobia bacterium]